MNGLLEVAAGRVGPETIDYNGHMNVVHFRAAFDAGTDGLFAHLGLGPDDYNARTGHTLMVVEEHTRYHAELAEGDGWRVLAQVVGHGAKTLHYMLLMERTEGSGEPRRGAPVDREGSGELRRGAPVGRAAGGLAASHEELALHVDLGRRRSAPFPPGVLAAVEALQAAQAGLPRPPDVGRAIRP